MWVLGVVALYLASLGGIHVTNGDKIGEERPCSGSKAGLFRFSGIARARLAIRLQQWHDPPGLEHLAGCQCLNVANGCRSQAHFIAKGT
jgi:hypothetical protein